MCRVAQERFPDEPAAAAHARGFTRRTFRRWELEELLPDVELAVTELVTNAILHARTPIVVTLSVEGGMAEVAVTDHDPRHPRLRPHREDLLADLDALHPTADDDPDPRHAGMHYGPSGSVAAGRGLIIVDAVAETWGVTAHPDGKDVWARLPIPRDWRYHSDCGCADHAPMATASGKPLAHIAGSWDQTADQPG